MAWFQVSKSNDRKAWRAEIRRPYVSATVWEMIAPDAIYATAKAAREAIETRYFEGSSLQWQRNVGRGSAYYRTGSNGSRHSDALPVQFIVRDSGEFAGDVTAIFPTLCGRNAEDVTCYAHIGQHGTASLDWAQSQRNATPAEYAALYRELVSIYEAGSVAERAALFVVENRREWMRNARLDSYRKARG